MRWYGLMGAGMWLWVGVGRRLPGLRFEEGVVDF
jgi:hypothetical protein